MHNVRRQQPPRAAALAVTLAGLLFNGYGALSCILIWATPRLDDQQSESESNIPWNLDTTRAVAGLAAVYFTAGTIACAGGFLGIFHRRLRQIRFFLHYTLADILFFSLSTIFLAFAAVRPSARSALCEQLSSESSITRTIAEYGFSLDNCESWWDRAVIGAVLAVAIIMIIRLQLTLMILAHYTHLRKSSSSTLPISSSSSSQSDLQKIYLLPSHSRSSHRRTGSVVYAPVDQLSIEEAQSLDATEAYIALAPRQSSSPSRSRTSRITPTVNVQEPYTDEPKFLL